jgi:hypothetical protein
MVRALQREPDFAELQFRLYPIYFIYDFAQRKGDKELSVSQFSRAFWCRPVRVKAALSNTLEELKAHDRHLAVDEDSGEEILE